MCVAQLDAGAAGAAVGVVVGVEQTTSAPICSCPWQAPVVIPQTPHQPLSPLLVLTPFASRKARWPWGTP